MGTLPNEAADKAADRAAAVAAAARHPSGRISSWRPTAPYAFTQGTASQDSHCRAAGLTGGVVDVIAAAVAAGVPVPGLAAPFGPPTHRQHDPLFTIDASPLELRAWAMEFAPALVDPAAPRMPGSRWW